VRVVSFLAQYATVDNNRLTVVHGAVDVLRPLFPYYITGIIYVPLEEANTDHQLRYRLATRDGDDVIGLDGRPVVFVFPLKVASPEGTAADAVFQIPHAVSVPGAPMAAGGYEWHVTVDGLGDSTWNARFEVLPPIQNPR
jgi:hypothetical protein